MAFDPSLAERVRQILRGRTGITERQMFGELAFLVDGKCVDHVAGLPQKPAK